ncbi:hypothetical protein EIP86_002823 [Pleurotus ostreatoroseus]|nr:hypothetical protein EIP86_002823 [Pleurotus ostreatoroseus]
MMLGPLKRAVHNILGCHIILNLRAAARGDTASQEHTIYNISLPQTELVFRPEWLLYSDVAAVDIDASNGAAGQFETRGSEPMNAVATISFPIFGPDRDQITLMRTAEGKPNEPLVDLNNGGDLARPLPERFILTHPLPPPGNLHVQLRLGDCIGYGRGSKVYDVEVIREESQLGDYVLPSLVAKIARKECDINLEHEGYCYEELHDLQGRIIPRCIGLFQGTLPPLHHANPLPQELHEEANKWWKLQERRVVSAFPRKLSILLVEKLGEYLPEPVQITDELRYGLLCLSHDYICSRAFVLRSGHVRKDIWNMYKELSKRGISHGDYEWRHIRRVLPQSPASTAQDGNAGYQWRIFDLDSASLANWSEYIWWQHLRSYVWRGVLGGERAALEAFDPGEELEDPEIRAFKEQYFKDHPLPTS